MSDQVLKAVLVRLFGAVLGIAGVVLEFGGRASFRLLPGDTKLGVVLLAALVGAALAAIIGDVGGES